jgi:hypothetical protein
VRPLPRALVGTWTRSRITRANAERFGVKGTDYRCVNTITIARDGNLTLWRSACRSEAIEAAQAPYPLGRAGPWSSASLAPGDLPDDRPMGNSRL